MTFYMSSRSMIYDENREEGLKYGGASRHKKQYFYPSLSSSYPAPSSCWSYHNDPWFYKYNICSVDYIHIEFFYGYDEYEYRRTPSGVSFSEPEKKTGDFLKTPSGVPFGESVKKNDTSSIMRTKPCSLGRTLQPQWKFFQTSGIVLSIEAYFFIGSPNETPLDVLFFTNSPNDKPVGAICYSYSPYPPKISLRVSSTWRILH